MKKTKKIALTGVFTALALAFSYIEFLIPFDMLGIPGIKPGFANLVVMAALYTLGLPYAAAVSLMRILLSFLLFGNVTSLLYSTQYRADRSFVYHIIIRSGRILRTRVIVVRRFVRHYKRVNIEIDIIKSG